VASKKVLLNGKRVAAEYRAIGSGNSETSEALLCLGMADVDWIQGDTLLSVSQGGATGSVRSRTGYPARAA
jgi:hypothetical protein